MHKEKATAIMQAEKEDKLFQVYFLSCLLMSRGPKSQPKLAVHSLNCPLKSYVLLLKKIKVTFPDMITKHIK